MGPMAHAIPTKFNTSAAAVAARTEVGSEHPMRGGEPFFVSRGTEIGVLALHGFTSTPHQFRDLARALADAGMTVSCPLVAGHGTSPRELAATTAEDWTRSIEEAFQSLAQRVRRVFLVGNSFGGNLAFWLAYRFPQRVAGVVSLGTPITLRFHTLLSLRLYTYGWLLRYHRKHGREYKIDYIDLSDQVSYPVIPTSSLREFFRFIKNKTMTTLPQVTAPTLMIQADADPVVHPRSVQFIHEHLGSDYKKVYWLNGRYHNLPDSDRREEICRKVVEFIRELSN